MPRTTHLLLSLPDGRTIKLDNDTDAGMLRWLLTSEAVPPNTSEYEFVRRLIRKRFDLGIKKFLELQSFPKIPIMDAATFLEHLPDEAHDRQLWSHPMIWVVNNWSDGGNKLRPWLDNPNSCSSDLEAALVLISSSDKELVSFAENWVEENFHLTPVAFKELFVQTSILNANNYYSRNSSDNMICRYRHDVRELIDAGAECLKEMESNLKSDTYLLKRLNKIVKDGKLSLLVQQAERISRQWQMKRSTQALRETKRNAIK